jgi:molybdate-binding protein
VVYAEAYDLNGRLVKEFAPKTVKKVQGRWELEEMEIINRRIGSRTRLLFELERK